MIPLDWDQTHNLNGTIFTSLRDWGANLIFQFGSGYPYTPQITNYEMQGEVLSNVLKRNSRRKPVTYRFDMKIHRKIKIGTSSGKIYLSITISPIEETNLCLWRHRKSEKLFKKTCRNY